MTTLRRSFRASWGAVITPSGRWWTLVAGCDGRVSRFVAGATGDESLGAPLLENPLHLLVRIVQRLRRGHPPGGGVREHRRQYERIEYFGLRRVGRPRMTDVRRPLQRRRDRPELRRRVRAERIVGRRLLEPPVARGRLLP